MKFLEMSEAPKALSEHVLKVRKEPLLVTRNGKPLAALLSVEGEDVESLSLALNQKFMAVIEKSRNSIKKRGGIPEQELRRGLGLSRSPSA